MLRGLLTAAVCFAATPRLFAAEPDYARDIKPLLRAKCYACHGAIRQKSGLRLDAGQLVLKGTKRGEVVVPGKPDQSPLVEMITAHGKEHPRMPPEGEGEAMSAKDVALVREWIKNGARAPDEPVPPDPKLHWAYQPVKRPAVPPIFNLQSPIRNPIDAFLAAGRAKHKLTTSAAADRPTLLRRVYLDLVGIPPTPEEIAAFLQDESKDAYEKVVDKLLASPLYGERWGRHWMDVWRYSDPFGNGEEFRYSQRHVWRWRDWIVESLNADKGYDRMIVEMLAGDEVAPGDRDTLRATGYLARNWYKFNRNIWIADTTEYTAAGFLGVTLRCAKCHDHKYDPIAQADYYRFRAFFEPHDVRIDAIPGQPDLNKDGVARVFDKTADAPTFFYIRGDERTPDKSRTITPGVPGVLGNDPAVTAMKFDAKDFAAALPAALDAARRVAKADLDVAETAAKVAAGSLTAARKRASELASADKPKLAAERFAKQAEKADAVAEAKLETARAALAAVEARHAADATHFARPPDEAKAKSLAITAGKAERTVAALKLAEAVLVADAKALDAAKKAHADAVALAAKDDPTYTPLVKMDPAGSTGRRLALAKWIADAKNPLTARVAVNHIWMRHFGTPLVPTVANFGLNGKPPTHPELLDWLASEFMNPSPQPPPRSGEGEKDKAPPSLVGKGVGGLGSWKMKHLHRLIATSDAYRLSSRNADGPNKTADPDNRFYWRTNSRRMDAEVVRDSLLAVAGQLDTRLGGPIIDETLGLTSKRRSLYFRFNAEYKMSFLDQFDAASPTECYERRESVIPQQALAMHNSVLALNVSREIAKQLAKEKDFVTAAFVRILGREPSGDELKRCEKFLADQTALYAKPEKLTPFPPGPAVTPPSTDPAQRAREDLAHVLLNHNDFVTVR